MIWILVTLFIGALGSFTFGKLKFPAGVMVGAMVFVAIFSISTGKAAMPSEIKNFTQMIAGAYIGASVQYRDLMVLKKILWPALIMIILMITLDIFMGFGLAAISNLDLVTALMACAPGGLMDITLISADVGADASKVAVLQLMRLSFVMAGFPLLLRKISQMTHHEPEKKLDLEVNDKDQKRLVSNFHLSKQERLNLFVTLVVAMVFGLLGMFSGIPAGAMTFAMICVAALNIITGRGYLPRWLREATKILAGSVIGVRMTYQSILALKEVFLPAMVLIIGIILINLTVGFFLNKLTKIGLLTALIASVPGGVSDMALIANELGGDQSKVAILQLFRYVFVVGVYPVLIGQITGLLH